VIRKKETRSLDDCFRLFDIIHTLVVDKEALRKLARDVIRDFARDNVVYLELRTTPRQTEFLSRQDYLTTIIEVIRECEADASLDIMVRFVVSINRANGVEQATEIVELVLKTLAQNQECFIVGLDFSGNPLKGHFGDFVPVLEAARLAGLKITIHCGEVEDPDEVFAIAQFKPERLGHALCIPDDLKQSLFFHGDNRSAIECCPTSNCKTLELTHIRGHPHLENWITSDCPVVLCTDDSGIFNTTLSKEFYIVAKEFKLSQSRILEFTLRAIENSFASTEDREVITKKLWAQSHL